MKYSSVLLVFLSILHITLSFECGKLICPENTVTCSIKNYYNDVTKTKLTNVTCFDINFKSLMGDNYVNDLPLKTLPIVECAGHVCKNGSFSCSSLTKFNVGLGISTSTDTVTCRDVHGTIIEEKTYDSEYKPKIEEFPIVVCKSVTCPKGSLGCKFVTTTKFPPLKEITEITCYDYKYQTLLETVV